jgi:hypothetical protein
MRDDIPTEFKHKVAPIVDKIYNSLIDEYDNEPDAKEFAETHPDLWDLRDNFAAYINQRYK